MSTLKTTNIKNESSSSNSIVLDATGGATANKLITTGITTISTAKVGTAVTISESGIEATGVGVTVASINEGPIGGRRNIIINGAMNVAQRGTSSTTSGYGSVDRWRCNHSGTNEAPTQAQHALTSSDTGPWAKGFKNSFHITNGNQTGGAGAGDYINVQYKVEAQDIACSSWDYTNTSSYITFSFWVKSSVAQNFYGYLSSIDGTRQVYPFETGSLSADTWTKIVKIIPGNSNITIDNNHDQGFQINISPLWGTNYTDSGVSLNTWAAYATGTRTPDSTSTWYTTDDATFEITGVQLEVGSVATPFEHRSYGEEHLRCARYYQEQQGGASDVFMYAAKAQGTTTADVGIALVVPLRGSPTVTCGTHRLFRSDDVGYTSSTTAPTVVQWDGAHSVHSATIALNAGGHSSIANNECCTWAPSSSSLLLDAEL